MTTHDTQMLRYTEEYRAPETTETPAYETEIATLLRQIVEQQKKIAESQADLERLTEHNLSAIRNALSGTK